MLIHADLIVLISKSNMVILRLQIYVASVLGHLSWYTARQVIVMCILYLLSCGNQNKILHN